MRKPHVFISSRLRLGKVRSKIRDLLLSTGFDPEIYEKDSTPSSEPTTYLKDVVDADFVIFVLDETYGTPRAKTDQSGLHEEWSLVIEEGIPYHVYLKRPKGERVERAQKKFIKEELIGREVSFFYYSNSDELLEQVKSSLARMTLDIARSTRYRARLGSELMKKVGFPDNADFESIYDELATTRRNPALKSDIKSRVQSYFAAMELPETPTLYDYLLLSLRDKDYVATFTGILSWRKPSCETVARQAFRESFFFMETLRSAYAPIIAPEGSKEIPVRNAERLFNL